MRRAGLRAHPGTATAWTVFAVVAAATLLRDVGVFAFDAGGYWSANTAVLSGTAVPDSYLALRGVLTSVTFLPAAALTAVIGDGLAGFAVLLQNALVIAAVAAFLVPRAAAPWRAVGTRGRWAAGALTWVTLQGFAPYPGVDLYAAAALLAALVLLARRGVRALVCAGALLGYAMNIRPAYLPVVALLVVAVVPAARLRTAWVALGAGVALLPQLLVNWATFGTASVTPTATGALTGLQTGYASYVVRYDTAIERLDAPQQFFCSPAMAGAVTDSPETSGELLGTYVAHLPQATLFSLEKVAAALHWPLSIPYLTENPGVNSVYALVITAIAVVGCAVLLGGPLLRRGAVAAPTWHAWLQTLAVVLATIATLAGSATEARFALPLVLLGVVGSTALVDAGARSVWRHPRALAATAVALLLVLVLGYAGLTDEAPPGDASREVCADV